VVDHHFDQGHANGAASAEPIAKILIQEAHDQHWCTSGDFLDHYKGVGQSSGSRDGKYSETATFVAESNAFKGYRIGCDRGRHEEQKKRHYPPLSSRRTP
jgi:hypothetical protein